MGVRPERLGSARKWCRIELRVGMAVLPVVVGEDFLGRLFGGTAAKSKMLEIGGMLVLLLALAGKYRRDE